MVVRIVVRTIGRPQFYSDSNEQYSYLLPESTRVRDAPSHAERTDQGRILCGS